MLINRTARSRWLSAEAAAEALGVSRQTLYAYVSRGLVRASPDPASPRRSLYDAHDIDALAERQARGRSRSAVASGAMNWGEPVLRSRITRVAEGSFAYRGHDAVALAETATLEEVAALLWACERLPEASASARGDRAPPAAGSAGRCIEHMSKLSGVGPWTRRVDTALPAAAVLLRALAEAACGGSGSEPIHALLSLAWTGKFGAAEVIRRCLVLSADHELNASTYAARVVASTRAPLGSCVLAGLAALGGPLHGGTTDAIRALMAEPSVMADPEATLGARLARGEHLPGFGHRMYPDGDPRAAAILRPIELPQGWETVKRAVAELTGLHPNVDFALVAVEQRFGLPQGAAFAMFAAGRCAGWIAHALEQWEGGSLIRPRADYAGP